MDFATHGGDGLLIDAVVGIFETAHLTDNAEHGILLAYCIVHLHAYHAHHSCTARAGGMRRFSQRRQRWR